MPPSTSSCPATAPSSWAPASNCDRAGPLTPSGRPGLNGSMISSGHLIGFTLAALIIIIIPGPGVLFVVGRALAHGRRTATVTAAGHAVGNYLVALCVAVGLGTLLERSEQVFTVVRLAG